MTAPVCPVSNNQLPYYHSLFRGGDGQPRPLAFPVIPPATTGDLPSLLRTINVMTDVLRKLTSSLTINNVYNPPPPFFKAQGDTNYSEFPNWEQKDTLTARGFVYHREKDGLDRSQRAYVERIFTVTFENRTQEDPEFKWEYSKPLDAAG